jgi:hypothetical protein
MRVCTAYIRGRDIYVIASAKNVFGIFQDCEPFFRLSAPISPQDLGDKVLQALASYRENAPGRTYIRGEKQPPSPFLLFSGFRSWRALEKGALHFSISSNDSEVEITPSVQRPKGGYLHQPERTVRCQAQPGPIGSLLLEQLPKP